MEIESIIFLSLWFVFGELLYLYGCSKRTKKEIKKDWGVEKIISFISGGLLSSLIYMIYVVLKNFFIQFLFGVLSVMILILFIYLNREIGFIVAGTKTKTKTKQDGKKTKTKTKTKNRANANK